MLIKIIFNKSNPENYEQGYTSLIQESTYKTEALVVTSITISNKIIDRLSTYAFVAYLK